MRLLYLKRSVIMFHLRSRQLFAYPLISCLVWIPAIDDTLNPRRGSSWWSSNVGATLLEDDNTRRETLNFLNILKTRNVKTVGTSRSYEKPFYCERITLILIEIILSCRRVITFYLIFFFVYMHIAANSRCKKKQFIYKREIVHISLKNNL